VPEFLIYSHKPQRGGRSIQANTNNPPQDPPPSPEKPIIDTPLEKPIVVVPSDDSISVDLQIPDIFIEDSTPPVPEICINTIHLPKPEIPKQVQTPKITKPKITKPKITKPKKVIVEKTVPPKEIPKVSLLRRFIARIRKIFGRK